MIRFTITDSTDAADAEEVLANAVRRALVNLLAVVEHIDRGYGTDCAQGKPCIDDSMIQADFRDEEGDPIACVWAKVEFVEVDTVSSAGSTIRRSMSCYTVWEQMTGEPERKMGSFKDLEDVATTFLTSRDKIRLQLLIKAGRQMIGDFEESQPLLTVITPTAEE